MRISMHKELERAVRFLNEGKKDEALQLITNFEKLGDLNHEDRHYHRFLKAFFF